MILKEVSKKNHLLIKIDEQEKEEGLEKTESGIFIAPDNKTIMVEYKTATIIKVSQVMDPVYDMYTEGDKIMIHPATKGSKIRDNYLVPIDVIFGRI